MTLAARLRAIVDALPPGAAVTLPADALRGWLDEEPDEAPVPQPAPEEPESWRTKLWAVPSDTRLHVREVAQAAGRSRDWAYRACDRKRAAQRGREPLPCSRIDGQLVFHAGAVRDWLRASEAVVNPQQPGPARLMSAGR
jgi:hypothetical protein